MKKEFILAAKGERKADLVILGGELVNVNTGEIHQSNVAIYKSRIVSVGEVGQCIGDETIEIDASGKFIIPGLIDPHIHVDVSKLTLTNFASVVVPRGTTSVMTSFDQVGGVAGIDGIRFFLDAAKNLPIRIFHVAPSRLPYTPFASTVKEEFEFKEHKQAFNWEEATGLWETTADQVFCFDEEVYKAMSLADERRLTIQGHCPGFKGAELSAYMNSGAISDHESTSAEETLEKLRKGLWVMLREASMAHNLRENMRAIIENDIDTRRVTLCSDDLDATDLFELGHMDHLIRLSIDLGVDPVEAIQFATINPAEAYNVDRFVGSISPGKNADVLLVDNLEEFQVEKVISNGNFVAENGKLLRELSAPTYPDKFYNTMNIGGKIRGDDLVIKVDRSKDEVNVISMNVPKEIPLRFRREENLKVKDGIVNPSIDKDVIYISVVERHNATGNKSTAFISGFNIKKGAIATSTSPDDNNIICIGTNSEDMAHAINYLNEVGGGQVAINGKEVIGELRLPICGLMTDKKPERVVEKEKKLREITKSWGCKIDKPFMFMMFMSISAIPEYAITDKGLVDTLKQEFINPIM